MTTPGMLTYDAIQALAAEDMLPCGDCPIEGHGWMVIDVQRLADVVLLRCPVGGCVHRFKTPEVVFMDDAARRKHGLLVTLA